MFDFLHLVLHREYDRLISGMKISDRIMLIVNTLWTLPIAYVILTVFTQPQVSSCVCLLCTNYIGPSPIHDFALCWKFCGPSSHYLFIKPLSLLVLSFSLWLIQYFWVALPTGICLSSPSKLSKHVSSYHRLHFQLFNYKYKSHF